MISKVSPNGARYPPAARTEKPPFSYRPQQESAETIALGFRDSPLRILLADTKYFSIVLRWLPRSFTPIWTQNPYSELYCSLGMPKRLYCTLSWDFRNHSCAALSFAAVFGPSHSISAVFCSSEWSAISVLFSAKQGAKSSREQGQLERHRNQVR